MHPVQKAAEDFTAWAIDECMKDPAYAAKVKAGEWCAHCDMSHPCLCDYDEIAKEMRPYLDKCTTTDWRGRAILIGDLERAKSQSWGRGEPIHEMLRGLLTIAKDGLKKRTPRQAK